MTMIRTKWYRRGNPEPSFDEMEELERRRALRPQPLTRTIIKLGPNVADLANERKHLQLRRHQDARDRDLRRLSKNTEQGWARYLEGKKAPCQSIDDYEPEVMDSSLDAA